MTDKIRVTIYIDKGVWGYVQEQAFNKSTKDNRKSASSWVEDLIRTRMPGVQSEAKVPDEPPVGGKKQLADEAAALKKATEKFIPDGKPDFDAIQAANKEAKLAKLKKSGLKPASDIPFVNYSKSKQTGKKGGK